MEAEDHQNGRRQRCRPMKDGSEIERLEGLRNELQAEYERLYIDHQNLYSQHEKTVWNAKDLELKGFELDNRTYRTQWQKFYEEEIALQELGATIRQYAERVRNRREEILQAIERLMKKWEPC